MVHHLVSENAVSIPIRRAQKHVGEASINNPPDNATPADTHAFEHVKQPVLYSAFISSYPVVYHCHM